MNTAEKPSRWKKFTSQLDLQSMVWPGIIFVFIFSYIPMYGVVMAFQQYDIFGGIMKSPGLDLCISECSSRHRSSGM